MVQIQNNPEFGPEYKPQPYTYKPDAYKPGPSKDPLKVTEFKPKEYKQSDNKLDYKPFQPTHVGMYGDKPRERVVRKPQTPVMRRIRHPRRTFESYRYPKGPDIRLGEMGPEYEVREYQPTQYKPYTPGKVRPRSVLDPIKSGGTLLYVDRPIGMYDGQVDYKLDEHNNAGMGHWRNEFVDDTVATYSTEGNDEKYKVDREPKQEPEKKREEPKPKESKPDERVEPKPVVAAVVLPVQRANSPPRKKTFTNSSSQHVGPAMKTGTTQTQANTMKTSATQYEATKTKTLGTQFEPQKTHAVSIQTSPTHTPIPAIVAAPLVKSEAPKKVKTTSQGVQCSDGPKKVVVKGTQSDGPMVRAMNTQTSPMPAAPFIAPIPVRERTPQYAEQVRHETPVYRAPERHSPPPTIIPIVAATSYNRRRTPTPKYRTPSATKRTPTPTKRTPTPTKRTPSPIKRTPSPKPTAIRSPHKEPTPARPSSDSRWTPSPEVAQSIPYVAAAAPLLSQQNLRSFTPKPELARQPSPKASVAKQDTPKPEFARRPSPQKTGAFPYASTKSRLPPEVIHCLEAYDNLHGP